MKQFEKREASFSIVRKNRAFTRPGPQMKANRLLIKRSRFTLPFLWAMRFASIAILCGILCAGLWPLHRPRNDVHWLTKQDGLQFGDFGTIVSSAGFQMAVSPNETASSL